MSRMLTVKLRADFVYAKSKKQNARFLQDRRGNKKMNKPKCCKNCLYSDYEFDHLDNMYIYCLLGVWPPYKKQTCERRKPVEVKK